MENTLIKVFNHFRDNDWDWGELSSNPNITLEFIKENLDVIPWDWKELSSNQNITPAFIKQHINKPWNWNRIAKHNHYITELITMFPNIHWDSYGLSNNPYNSYDIMMKSGIPFSAWILGSVIIDYKPMMMKQHYSQLIHNKNLLLDDLKICLKHVLIENSINNDDRWIWNAISDNLYITKDFVDDNIYKPWNWEKLLQNPNIRAATEIINEFNDEKSWVWRKKASRHPNIMMSDIINNSHLTWRIDGIAENPNLSFDYILKNFNNFELLLITKNLFLHYPTNIKQINNCKIYNKKWYKYFIQHTQIMQHNCEIWMWKPLNA